MLAKSRLNLKKNGGRDKRAGETGQDKRDFQIIIDALACRLSQIQVDFFRLLKSKAKVAHTFGVSGRCQLINNVEGSRPSHD